MNTAIRKAGSAKDNDHLILLSDDITKVKGHHLSADELGYLRKADSPLTEINQYKRWVYIQKAEKKKPPHLATEAMRKAGHILLGKIKKNKIKSITIIDLNNHPDQALSLAEGIALSNYKFLKYFRDAAKRKNPLTTINIVSDGLSKNDVQFLEIGCQGNSIARTLVNEPLSFLTATQLSVEIKRLGKEAGFKTEVLNKARIESLKMGGLLAVNKGSLDPPTFNILEWKPSKPLNSKPVIFVGKGIVYDTGGLSLKPTPNSMDEMKCDMAGAAAVVGALYTIAKARLPMHVIGLIPATDNRPGGNAYVPGDVINIYGGATVEVLNTDAEGRLVLADALVYAKKFKPELVIDLATLTGSAVRAIGIHGSVSMGNADRKVHDALIESGNRVYERLAELPFWPEYEEEMKSDIADIKNLGGPNAGAITAGKFLEFFVKDHNGKHAYPWIHLDIAGPAFLTAEDSYRGKWGSGVGVRLLFEFIKNRTK